MPYRTKPYMLLGLGRSLRNVEYTIDDRDANDRRLRETGLRTVRASVPIADASAIRVREGSVLVRIVRKALGVGDVQVAGANFQHLCRNVPDVEAFIAAIEGKHPDVRGMSPEPELDRVARGRDPGLPTESEPSSALAREPRISGSSTQQRNGAPNRYQQYVDVYLQRHEDVVEWASKLYAAGRARAVFAIDEPDGLTKVEKLLFALVLPFRAQPNPYVSRLDEPSRGRNKLMVFDSWVIRCTYQQYSHDNSAELFYYSGSPIAEIETVVFHGADSVGVHCKHGDLGGMMFTSREEGQQIYQTLQQLKKDGMLSTDAIIRRQ